MTGTDYILTRKVAKWVVEENLVLLYFSVNFKII